MAPTIQMSQALRNPQTFEWPTAGNETTEKRQGRATMTGSVMWYETLYWCQEPY